MGQLHNLSWINYHLNVHFLLFDEQSPNTCNDQALNECPETSNTISESLTNSCHYNRHLCSGSQCNGNGQKHMVKIDMLLYQVDFTQKCALWNTLGNLLEGSGWTAALTEAEVASAGMADSFLKATHLTQTRHAHQVTLLALHNMQSQAFELVTGSTRSQNPNI